MADQLTEGKVKSLFDGFKQILRQGGTFSAVILDMIERTSGLSAVNDFLNNLRDVAKNIDSISDCLFAKYKIAENQPEDEREGWSLQEIYSSVEEELNGLMTKSRIASDGRKPESKNDEEVWMLIVWSVELWFLFNLQKCKHDSVKRFIESNAVELFHEFFDPRDKDEPRFEVLAEKDCVDIMKKLLCPKLGVSSFLLGYLDKKDNVKEFCKTPMSKEMIRTVEPYSKLVYIIPRPSEGIKFAKMYGIIVSGFFIEDATASTSDHGLSFPEQEERAANKMSTALQAVGVEVKQIKLKIARLPSSEVFPYFKETFKEVLNKIEHCSLFIMSIFCHGAYGYLHNGNCSSVMKIEELLIILKVYQHLQGIPKVCNIYIVIVCKIIVAIVTVLYMPTVSVLKI